jgi:hypothetical protein
LTAEKKPSCAETKERPLTSINFANNAIIRDANVEMVGEQDADILGDDYDIGAK